jgi:hypothetical protein
MASSACTDEDIDNACEAVCASVASALLDAFTRVAANTDAFPKLRAHMFPVDATWFRQLHGRLFDKMHSLIAAHSLVHELFPSKVLCEHVLLLLEREVCLFFEKLRLWMRLDGPQSVMQVVLRTEIEGPVTHTLVDPKYNTVEEFHSQFMQTRNAFEMLVYLAWNSARWDGDTMVHTPDLTPVLQSAPRYLQELSRADAQWCCQQTLRVYLRLAAAVQSFRMSPPEVCEWYSARHTLYHQMNTAMYGFFGVPYEVGSSSMWTELLEAGFVGARSCCFAADAAADAAVQAAAVAARSQHRVLPRATGQRLSLAALMALHHRLGRDSALAQLGEDMLQEVLRHVFVSSSELMPGCPISGWSLVGAAWIEVQ